MKENKIKIVRRYGKNYSYFIDENGLLNGQWGGFEEKYDYEKDRTTYNIYYSKFSRYIPIDEKGNFYFRYSCLKYDGVLKLSNNLFICEKNNRFGLMSENEIPILHTAFRRIKHKTKEFQNNEYEIFFVESELGTFLYNYTTEMKSNEFEEILDYSEEYFLFKKNGKYGLIDNNGKLVVDALYEKNSFFDGIEYYLFTELLGRRFPIHFKENKIYGKIPIGVYDNCVRLGDFLHGYFITYKNGKYGLLNHRGDTIIEPKLETVCLYGKWRNFNHIQFFRTKPTFTGVNIIFVIVKKDNKYALYDVVSGKCIISDCDDMNFVIGPERIQPKEFDYIHFYKNGNEGYVTYGGFVIDKEVYEDFYQKNKYWVVKNNGKWGVLYLSGFEYIPMKYDKLEYDYDGLFKAIENGITKSVGENTESNKISHSPHYSRQELMVDTWDAMTDGQYGDMPDGFDGDFDFLGF